MCPTAAPCTSTTTSFFPGETRSLGTVSEAAQVTQLLELPTQHQGTGHGTPRVTLTPGIHCLAPPRGCKPRWGDASTYLGTGGQQPVLRATNSLWGQRISGQGGCGQCRGPAGTYLAPAAAGSASAGPMNSCMPRRGVQSPAAPRSTGRSPNPRQENHHPTAVRHRHRQHPPLCGSETGPPCHRDVLMPAPTSPVPRV